MNRIIKTIEKAEARELAYKRWQQDLEYSRLPEWIQANHLGDRLADGSDDQEYDPDYPEDVESV